MGIPLVALQGQGPEIAKGLGDIVPNQLKLRAMLDEQAQRQQDLQLGQTKLTDWQQMQQKQAAIHQAIATNGGLEQALPDIEKIDPKFALDARKGLSEWNKASTDEKISKLNLHQKNAERAAQLASGATDQPSWTAALGQAHKENVLDDETYQSLSKTPYSPDVVKGIQEQSLTAAQRINEQKEALAQQKADEQAKQAAERERLAAMPQEDKLFQNHYDKLVEAGQVEKNAATWLSERQKWDAAQAKNKAAQKLAGEKPSKPNFGYTTDDKGNVVYDSEENAAKKGQVFEQITPTDVNKDRQALSLMGNAQLNTSRYKQALNALPGPISIQHVGWMQDIVSDPKLDDATLLNYAGAGSLAPTIRQIGRAKEWNMLSDPERNALSQFLRAKAAVLSYQRAITNQGRTNPEALHVEFSTIPEPYVGASAAAPRFNAFQENIDQVSSRFPSNLPGVEHPRDIQKRIEGESPKAGTFKIGDFITQGGERYKVTKVDSNGKVLEAE